MTEAVTDSQRAPASEPVSLEKPDILTAADQLQRPTAALLPLIETDCNEVGKRVDTLFDLSEGEHQTSEAIASRIEKEFRPYMSYLLYVDARRTEQTLLVRQATDVVTELMRVKDALDDQHPNVQQLDELIKSYQRRLKRLSDPVDEARERHDVLLAAHKEAELDDAKQTDVADQETDQGIITTNNYALRQERLAEIGVAESELNAANTAYNGVNGQIAKASITAQSHWTTFSPVHKKIVELATIFNATKSRYHVLDGELAKNKTFEDYLKNIKSGETKDPIVTSWTPEHLAVVLHRLLNRGQDPASNGRHAQKSGGQTEDAGLKREEA